MSKLRHVLFCVVITAFVVNTVRAGGKVSTQAGAAAAAGSAAGAPSGFFQKVKTGLVKWFSDSKTYNKEYVAGSCWRTYKRLEASGQCPDGFTRRLGTICSANCPLERPVKCGPVCLPQGRSCANEGVKKATVTGLIVAKATGFGTVGDACAKLILKQTARRDVGNTRNLETATECADWEKSFQQLSAEQFAGIVGEVFPEDKAKEELGTTRRLSQKIPDCGQGVYEAFSKFLEAVKKSRSSGGTSGEALRADAQEAEALGKAVLTCAEQGGEWAPYVATGLEVMIEGLIGRLREGKTTEEALKEVGLNLIVKLNPYGTVAFAHEFVREMCPVATIPDLTFNALNMDNKRENLGLKGIVAFPTNRGTWNPSDLTNVTRVKITNKLDFAVSLKVYSGGRRFRDKPAAGTSRKGVKKVLTLSPAETGLLEVPLEEVKGKTMYFDALLEADVMEKLKGAAKNLANDLVKAATFGKKSPVFEEQARKLGSLVFWVPNKAQGLLFVESELAKPTGAAAASP